MVPSFQRDTKSPTLEDSPTKSEEKEFKTGNKIKWVK